MMVSRNPNHGHYHRHCRLFLVNVVVVGLLALVPTARAQTCTPSAGTYCPSSSGSASTCPAGYYCSGDPANDLVACPAGTFNSLTGQSASGACSACATNYVALTPGQSACQHCAAGSVYADAQTCAVCASGTYAASGDTACGTCAAGYAAASGAAACTACRPGTFASGTRNGVCTACPANSFTYTTNSNNGVLTPVWGATSQAACVANPSAANAALTCLPGTRILGAACAACPVGYYCPAFSTYAGGPGASNNRPGQVKACPAGTSTPGTGAMAASECSIPAPLQPFNFVQCAVTPGDVSALTALSVRAVTTSYDTNAVYFATATAVYRLYLQSNTLELLAGTEGTAGSVVDGAVGTNARFTSITAIAVDLDQVAPPPPLSVALTNACVCCCVFG